MRIDNKVFKRHKFRLEDCYIDRGNHYETFKVWRKEDFAYEFVTNNEKGYFDDSDSGNCVRPSEECEHNICLLYLLDTSEELCNMVKETWALDDYEREERFRKSHAGTESDDLPADDGKGESK